MCHCVERFSRTSDYDIIDHYSPFYCLSPLNSFFLPSPISISKRINSHPNFSIRRKKKFLIIEKIGRTTSELNRWIEMNVGY